MANLENGLGETGFPSQRSQLQPTELILPEERVVGKDFISSELLTSTRGLVVCLGLLCLYDGLVADTGEESIKRV